MAAAENHQGGFAPMTTGSAPGPLDYFHTKFSPLAPIVLEILTTSVKTITPNFGERAKAGRSKMEHNKRPYKNYFQ